MVERKHTESNEQIAAMDWLRLQHPMIALHMFHTGNGRRTSHFAGYIGKRMGVLKGVSDLFMAWPTSQFHGLFIEVKSKTGKPTPEQLAFITRMNSVGYYATVCYGADEVIRCIKWYLAYQGTPSSSTPAEAANALSLATA